jgi:hypothetical protein
MILFPFQGVSDADKSIDCLVTLPAVMWILIGDRENYSFLPLVWKISKVKYIDKEQFQERIIVPKNTN